MRRCMKLQRMLSPLKRLFPGQVTTTEELGRAMLQLVKRGFAERVLENRDIATVAGGGASLHA